MVKEIVKQVIICDRCGKQLLTGEKIGYVEVHQRLEPHGDAINKNEFEDMDFCEECLCDITRYVACSPRKDKQDKTEMVSIPENPDKVDKTENGSSCAGTTACKRTIDYGKILALSNAGWDNKKIAEEMGMTPQQVSDAKWKAKKKQEAGTLILGRDDNVFMGGD